MQSRLFSHLFSLQARRMRYLRVDPLFRPYWREVANRPLLNQEEEACLLAQAATSSVARNTLLEGNQRLVILIAVAFAGQGVPLSELIQEGNLGLLHALERFDPHKTRRLSTYAKYWIVQHIQQALCRNSHAVSLSERTVQSLAQMEQHIRQAEAQGIAPDPRDLASRCHLSVEQVMALLPLREGPLSLQHSSLEAGPLSEIVAAPPLLLPDPESQSTCHPALMSALARLNEREQQVLRLRFGLEEDGVVHDNYHEIAWLVFHRQGKRVDERIRQIEKRALVKMHAFLEGKEPPAHKRRRRPTTAKSAAKKISQRQRKEARLDEDVPCS
ncbi:sigma-70 family RNA polymerase sigma factor [Reticulibacter mediterranei]|uniref:sigma-70 family RNA polymerase sigma factor n=1 Tax=Reticulibacter mediterranei TaxID=2778369 RepID=UPI001C68A9C0|nr:sigma-70 family RNA polymerase sigma factor [Reticulibacter mediterranei]